MPRRPAPFTQADVARAVKGAASAGLRVGRVEIAPDGRIIVVSAEAAAPREPSDPFDAWKESRRGAG
ncbi:hypothetical protein [Salinarimonas chemoclinalis]|uniref:hypothetical protein n=1 Tax=Salinarimonas chemoclinalis TaxID=3241599 RepID=UPI00355761D1